MTKTDYVLLADALPAWSQGGAAMAIRLDAIEDAKPEVLTLPIVPGTIVGLRRQIVTALDGAVRTKQQLQFAPWTPTLVRLARDFYRPLTGWNYDFPNPKTEDAASPRDVARIIERLREQVKILPMYIQIVGVQRRYLLYYSDGNKLTQVRYLRLAPKPGRDSPFGEDWELRESYRNDTNSGTPLLYDGPAWTVRFTVDGVDPIPDCRVYVDDDGRFICSDWCQRTGYTTYGKGIDLQVQGYTLGSWIAGPVSQQGRIRLPAGSRITIVNQAGKQARAPNSVDKQLAELVPFVQAAWISGARTIAEIYAMAEYHRVNGGALVDVPVFVKDGSILRGGKFSIGKGSASGQFVDGVSGLIQACARHQATINAAGIEIEIADVMSGPLGVPLETVPATPKKWYEVAPAPTAPITTELKQGDTITWTPEVQPPPQAAVDSWDDIPPPQIPVEMPEPVDFGDDFDDHDVPLGVMVLGKPSPVCWPCFVNYELDAASMTWSCPGGCGAPVLPFHYVKTQQCDNCGGPNHFTPGTLPQVMENSPCIWCNSSEKGHIFYGPAAD